MGLASSCLGLRRSRPGVNRSKNRLASFLCGGSTSHAPIEIKNSSAGLLRNRAEEFDPILDDVPSSRNDYSIFSPETECSGSQNEDGASSETESSNGTKETGNRGKSLSESKELVHHQVDVDYSPIVSHRERTNGTASAMSREQQSLDSVSTNVRASVDAIVESNDGIDVGTSPIFLERVCSSSTSCQEHGDPCAYGMLTIDNYANDVMSIDDSNLSSVPVVSVPLVTSESVVDDSAAGAAAPGPGFLAPFGQEERRNGSVLHVDVVSISSNILSSSSGEISNREARRNSRRLFWDAFSRRSSRRHSDSPTVVFSNDDADDLGSHDRWLLDFSGDLLEDGVGGDSEFLGSRNFGMHGRRRQSRSEIWERLRGGLDDNGRQTSYCASGLHPDGTCSCESFLGAEESGTHASISRIVMLAEALFEVLDEIHRQPVPLSLSMVSLPAPASVVDSFPLKNHRKPDTSVGGDDVEQCYICLAEYEEGDKIRMLPCRHEYHMSCVDKWLKEIHGVCPLCRGDVCEGTVEVSVSNS